MHTAGYIDGHGDGATSPLRDLESIKSCLDCGNRVEWYWMKDELWAHLVAPEDFKAWICVRCIGSRLRRTLTPDDLTDARVNQKPDLLERLANSYGYCYCNCGQKTEPYRHTDCRTGVVKGQPRKFIKGHGRLLHLKGPRYIVEDLGYETPCWIWQHGRNKGGYGRISGSKYAHVVAYEEAYGPVPEGKMVDHVCHNEAQPECAGGPTCPHRLCLNPAHLRAVPTGQNTRAGKRAKLTREQVRDIRSRPRGRGTTTALALEFQVHPGTITNVRNHSDRVWPEE